MNSMLDPGLKSETADQDDRNSSRGAHRTFIFSPKYANLAAFLRRAERSEMLGGGRSKHRMEIEDGASGSSAPPGGFRPS